MTSRSSYILAASMLMLISLLYTGYATNKLHSSLTVEFTETPEIEFPNSGGSYLPPIPPTLRIIITDPKGERIIITEIPDDNHARELPTEPLVPISLYQNIILPTATAFISLCSLLAMIFFGWRSDKRHNAELKQKLLDLSEKLKSAETELSKLRASSV